MYKFLFFISVLLIGATQAQAQLLSGCTMNHGSVTHSVSLVGGSYIGRFSFPYYIDYEEDITGQTLSINAPLSNDGTYSLGLPFLEEKKDFLNQIFRPELGLTVEFDQCELQQSADGSLSARFCYKSGPFEINGIALRGLEFGLQNQFRTSLTGSEGQTTVTEVTNADLTFTTEADANGKATRYRSSFSYFPNGDSVQCHWN